MAFKNKIRLPFYLSKPQFPDESTVATLADGSTKILSIVTRKVYKAKTDYFSERIHQRLKAALTHDSVFIESETFVGNMRIEPNSYKINWPEFIDYPLGQAEFDAVLTPFALTNDNCQTCEEATQLNLADDTFYPALTEDNGFVINVFGNDQIFCSPFTAEITWFNPLYVEVASIELTGKVTIVTKASMPDATNVKLVTYRVTCPNGNYDEADVYGDIDGSFEACQPPSNLVYTHIPETIFSTESEEISFDLSPSSPANGYDWELYECDNLGTPVLTGNVADSPIIILPALELGSCYRIAIRANCGEDNYSSWVNIEFNTPGPATSCGRFALTNTGFLDGETGEISFYGCGGTPTNAIIGKSNVRCMLMDGSNNPVYFVNLNPLAEVTYEFIEPC